jgi:STE24 endopeptidase
VRRAQGAGLAWAGLLLVVLLATPLSASMRAVAASAAGAAGAPSVLVPSAIVAFYVLMLAAAHECVALPLAYYRGHVLESRYGLSTQTGERWFRAHVKAAMVGLAFALAGAVVLYTAIRRWPDTWWVAVAVALSLLMACLARVGPVLLLPIFYRVAPLQRDDLRARLVELAGRAGAPVLNVHGWTLGDSTRKANAALVGMGRTRRILLSDTLLSDYSEEEVEVVLAHELAHHVHGDVWRSLAFESVLAFVGAYLAHRVLADFGPLVGLGGPADVAGLPLVLLAFGAVSVAAVPLANAQSRAHERRADRFALTLTRNPAAFSSAMRRLAQQNLAEERPTWWVQTFFHSHPPVAERLQMAACRTSSPGAGGASC